MCFSSVHSLIFYRVRVRGLGWPAEAWFCAQWPIVVLFLRFVFVLLYGWKIQTWPIIRFLTESVTYWCQQDVQDLQQKYRPSTSKIRQYISLYTWGTFYPCVHQTHLGFLLLKSYFFCLFHLTIEASPIWIFVFNYFLQFSSCGPWRVFSHSNSPPHRALGRYRPGYPGCSWRSTTDIDTRPLPGRFKQFYVDWKFLIIALMVEMGIFTALALLKATSLICEAQLSFAAHHKYILWFFSLWWMIRGIWALFSLLFIFLWNRKPWLDNFMFTISLECSKFWIWMEIYFRDILLIIISRGANNCVQNVFEKKHLFHNDISPILNLYYPVKG